jgi:hypothetical protein
MNMEAVTLLSQTDIQRIVDESVQKAFTERKKVYPSKISVAEAAKLLGRSKNTVHRWSCYRWRDIPVQKSGSRLMFDLQELKAWARPLGMIVEETV